MMEVYKLSATAMQEIAKDINGLVCDVLKDFTERVIVAEPAVTSVVHSALKSFDNIFEDLDSEYKFRKYLRNSLDFVVSYPLNTSEQRNRLSNYRSQLRLSWALGGKPEDWVRDGRRR